MNPKLIRQAVTSLIRHYEGVVYWDQVERDLQITHRSGVFRITKLETVRHQEVRSVVRQMVAEGALETYPSFNPLTGHSSRLLRLPGEGQELLDEVLSTHPLERQIHMVADRPFFVPRYGRTR